MGAWAGSEPQTSVPRPRILDGGLGRGVPRLSSSRFLEPVPCPCSLGGEGWWPGPHPHLSRAPHPRCVCFWSREPRVWIRSTFSLGLQAEGTGPLLPLTCCRLIHRSSRTRPELVGHRSDGGLQDRVSV